MIRIINCYKQIWRQQKIAKMDYFKTISLHLPGNMDIDAMVTENNQLKIMSLGSDDLVKWRNVSTNEAGQIQLPAGHQFDKIAMHPKGDRFLIGGQCKKLYQYCMETKSQNKIIYESLGHILDPKYSTSGRFISVATDEQKVIVFDTETNRRTKCRPGHSNRVLNTFFSPQDKFVASIGQDCLVLIYQLFPDKDPQQVFRTKYTNDKIQFGIQGSFSQGEQHKVFVPGTNSLQIVEQLTNRWQINKTNIAHSLPIVICQTLRKDLLVTSCAKDMCIWDINKQEKLIVLQDWAMTKIVSIPGNFIGIRNDGSVYIYNRNLPKLQIESHPQLAHPNLTQSLQPVDFNNQAQLDLQPENEAELDLQHDPNYDEPFQKQSKKKFADKIIKTLPQIPLSRATTFFDEYRFVFMNLYGYIIESREVQEICVTVQWRKGQGKEDEGSSRVLWRNRKDEVLFYDLNAYAVAYASQNHYGLKIDSFSYWEKDWYDIQGVVLGTSWMAVASVSEIRFVDFSGNLVKSVCFDKIIVAMSAYQNLLAIVYHQGIPLYQNQNLAMKIFNFNSGMINQLPQCHVPITTPQFKSKGNILRWFGFSSEGMLFSQDSKGSIRAYSLQSNEWTPLIPQSSVDPKKAWIVAIHQYSIKFFRTTDSEPEPTVRPRLPLKQSKLMIDTATVGIEQLQSLPSLLWRRYCLDHEKARWRLWGNLKMGRDRKHVAYQNTESIMNEKQLYNEHLKLDSEYYNIIKFYLKAQQIDKAMNTVKNHIRLIKTGRNLIQFFDELGHRSQSIQLQYFYDQKEKQIQYEAIQQLALKELKTKLQVSINTKRQNPMNPKFKKNLNQQIPFSYNMSSQSQSSSIMEDITFKSQQNSRVEERYPQQRHTKDKEKQKQKEKDEFQNPYLKKKSTNDRKKQIQEHLQRYGVKRKAEQKKSR